MNQSKNIVQEIKSMDELNKILYISQSDKKLIVIDFFADWCQPCKMISPYVDKLAEKYYNVHF